MISIRSKIQSGCWKKIHVFLGWYRYQPKKLFFFKHWAQISDQLEIKLIRNLSWTFKKKSKKKFIINLFYFLKNIQLKFCINFRSNWSEIQAKCFKKKNYNNFFLNTQITFWIHLIQKNKYFKKKVFFELIQNKPDTP